jgi:hypothetical protein
MRFDISSASDSTAIPKFMLEEILRKEQELQGGKWGFTKTLDYKRLESWNGIKRAIVPSILTFSRNFFRHALTSFLTCQMGME